jgi:hypothetical protein
MSTRFVNPRAKDYEGRLSDFSEFVLDRYGIEPQESHIIAACLLATAPDNPCWLICDSHKNDFWVHLQTAINAEGIGTYIQAESLRPARPRTANKYIELLSRKAPFIMSDRLFQVPNLKSNPRSRWREIEEECLRLRVRPSWIKTQTQADAEELRRLLRLVIDPEFRQIYPKPYPTPPELMIHACKIVSGLNPALTSPQSVIRNAAILLTAHAVVEGRDKLEGKDHLAVHRVLLDSIRPWTHEILESFAENDGALTIEFIQKSNQFRRDLVVGECAYLAETGILDWPKPLKQGGRRKWIHLTPGLGMDTINFVQGEFRWW